MRWADKLLLRLRSLYRRPQVEEELDNELRFHLEQQIAENLAAGMSAEEARYAAQRVLGGAEQIKEKCRDMRRVQWIGDFLQDVQYAIRNLGQSPGFAAAVLLVLALGIGANTAVFSLIDAVLLKRLPVREPDQLFQLIRPGGENFDQDRAYFSYLMFRGMSERVASFADLTLDGASDGDTALISGGGEERVKRQAVSGNYFGVLGVEPAVGRLLTPDDDREPGKEPVIVLSYSLWKRRFNLDPAVLGRTVRFGKDSFEIIGVSQPGFFGIEVGTMADMWTPAAMEPAVRLTRRGYSWHRVIARLKPGVTAAQASAQLQVFFHQWNVDDLQGAPPDTPPDLVRKFLAQRIKLVSAARGISPLRTEYRQPLQIAMVVVVIVLLVACTNIANFLLAKGSARQREMAVRLALGAGRFRLVRQLFTESGLLAVSAALVGFLLAHWSAPVLVSLLAPSDSPVQLALGTDWRVLCFTAAVGALTVVLFGLMPAFRSSNVEIQTSLKSGARLGGRRPGAARALVTLQVALSLVLLVGATLFLRTLLNLVTLDPGFDRRNVIVAEMHFTGAQKDTALLAWQDLLRRSSTIPGVESASVSVWSLFSHSGQEGIIRIMGKPLDPRSPECSFMRVSDNFFRTMGTRLIAGRDFDRRDLETTAPRVAVINETLARRYFPNENPLGRIFSDMEENPPKWTQVIGVVEDSKLNSLRRPAPPIIYLPYPVDRVEERMSLEIRARIDVGSIGPALRRIASPGFTVETVTTQTKLVDDTLMRERLLAKIGSFFGGLALLLAAIGLYGIMSYAVAQRAPEFGIRMALGAERRDILGMVFRGSLLIVSVGAALGTALALGMTRLVASLLFGVTPNDPFSVLIAVLVLAAIALIAAFIPAYRAARTDPMITLRYE